MRKVFQLIRFLYEYLVDCYFALRYGAYSPFEEKNKRLYYQLVYLTHTVEKGMSLNNPRPCFGKEKIRKARGMLSRYDASYSMFPMQMLSGALSDYLAMHQQMQVEDPWLDEVRAFLEEVIQKYSCTQTGGYREVGEEYRSAPSCMDPKHFLQMRFSCRSYADEVVAEELLEQIIQLAQSAPSQCNRQSVRAHVFNTRQKIDELLELQAGANGFSHDISNLFVISSELTSWGGPGQRNQAYVDGSLFAMNLMLACQAYGIATCPLNLAVDNRKEAKIKQAAGIHSRERLIMMMAFGQPHRDLLKAASSPRRNVGDVLIKH